MTDNTKHLNDTNGNLNYRVNYNLLDVLFTNLFLMYTTAEIMQTKAHTTAMAITKITQLTVKYVCILNIVHMYF